MLRVEYVLICLISRMSMSGNNIGVEGVRALCPHLDELVNITELSLAGTCVVRALRVWSGLSFAGLCLAGNNITAKGASELGVHIEKLVTLRKLSLYGTCTAALLALGVSDSNCGGCIRQRSRRRRCPHVGSASG